MNNPEPVSSSLFVPDPIAENDALRRTTHLGIGAHQDDLEFMALHGILECYGRSDRWFGGIICTNGTGSVRGDRLAGIDEPTLAQVRMQEQIAAAKLGCYSFVAQLSHPSSTVRESTGRGTLVKELADLLLRSEPEILYSHNPFDKHPTHISVLISLWEALRSIPQERRPRRWIGCEVWRGLDWLPDSQKLVLDVSAHADLAEQLAACFKSQIDGGKRYDLAVEGRRRANATFYNPHQADTAQRVDFAIELTPLLRDESSTLEQFASGIIDQFQSEIVGPLKAGRHSVQRL